jgi:trk system potassium uptake protein
VNVIVIGSGRVGSSVAKLLQSEGCHVTVIDEKEEALSRLGADWPGGFVVGHGMDTEILYRAGIEDAGAVVVATNGDNTNIVIGQVVRKRYGIDCTFVRLLDPARADFYAQRGMHTVCPTQTAISALVDAVRDSQKREVSA